MALLKPYADINPIIIQKLYFLINNLIFDIFILQMIVSNKVFFDKNFINKEKDSIIN